MSEALDVLAALVLEDGRRWGEAAVEFQREDARAILDPDATAPYHFLTRSRGGAKTSDLAGIAIAAMLAELPRGAKLFGLAADRDQGRLLIESIEGYAVRTPELRGAFDVGAYKVTAKRGGQTLEILAADAPGAWGLRPSFVVVDEIAQWGTSGAPRRLWEAVTTSAGKVPGCRMVVLTTAGDPAHWSRRVLDHALSDPLWRVHEVPGPAPWADRARLAEQKRRLPDTAYRRLFENQWVASEDRLASPDDLAALVTLDGSQEPRRGLRYVLGIDLGLKKDRTVATICHAERMEVEDGQRVVLDRIEVWQGSRDTPVEIGVVEQWVEEAAGRYFGARVVADPWQAIGMLQRLRSRGVQVTEYPFTAQSVAKLALTLLDAIRGRRLALPNDRELLDELANVRLRESSPGVYRIDHDSDRNDDRVISLALAAGALLERPLADPNSHAELSGIPIPYYEPFVPDFIL